MTHAGPAGGPISSPRPGGRSARVRHLVLWATLELLAEGGYDAIELPEIARRAGVHPATVYRRWGTKVRLVGEAMLEERSAPLSRAPDTGSLQADLQQLVEEGTALMRTPAVRALFQVLLADALDPPPEMTRARDRFWEAHRVEAAKIVQRAVARGELPADTDAEELIELVIGPALVRMVVSGRPLDEAMARTVASRIVSAFA